MGTREIESIRAKLARIHPAIYSRIIYNKI
jgi:hypothetical protein